MRGKWRCWMFVLVLILGLTQPIFAQKPSLVKSGVLTYGVAATFPPFEYQEGDKLVGFDIELGDALAKKMGLKASPLNMDFKGIIPALQGKRIDIINSAMYIKPERAEQVDFIPYLKVGEEVMVKKGNPKKVSGVDNLCGKSVAVTLGAIEEIYARISARNAPRRGSQRSISRPFPLPQTPLPQFSRIGPTPSSPPHQGPAIFSSRGPMILKLLARPSMRTLRSVLQCAKEILP